MKLLVKAFNAVVTKKVEKDDLERVITDGYFDHADINLETAFQIQKHGPWGHGFPEPLFQSSFEVLEQRIVGSNHLKLVLSIGGEEKVNAIYFNCDEFWPNYDVSKVNMVYRLDVNEYRGFKQVQLIVEYIEPVN